MVQPGVCAVPRLGRAQKREFLMDRLVRVADLGARLPAKPRQPLGVGKTMCALLHQAADLSDEELPPLVEFSTEAEFRARVEIAQKEEALRAKQLERALQERALAAVIGGSRDVREGLALDVEGQKERLRPHVREWEALLRGKYDSYPITSREAQARVVIRRRVERATTLVRHAGAQVEVRGGVLALLGRLNKCQEAWETLRSCFFTCSIQDGKVLPPRVLSPGSSEVTADYVQQMAASEAVTREIFDDLDFAMRVRAGLRLFQTRSAATCVACSATLASESVARFNPLFGRVVCAACESAIAGETERWRPINGVRFFSEDVVHISLDPEAGLKELCDLSAPDCCSSSGGGGVAGGCEDRDRAETARQLQSTSTLRGYTSGGDCRTSSEPSAKRVKLDAARQASFVARVLDREVFEKADVVRELANEFTEAEVDAGLETLREDYVGAMDLIGGRLSLGGV